MAENPRPAAPEQNRTRPLDDFEKLREAYTPGPDEAFQGAVEERSTISAKNPGTKYVR